MTIELKHHVNAVACCSWYFADDATFFFGQRVDEGTFSDVASANDGDFHRRWFEFLGVCVEVWKMADDPIEQIGFVSVLQDAHAHQVFVAELMELISIGVERWAIGFVCHQQDWFVDFAKPVCDLGVEGDHSRSRVDDKEQYVSFFDCS